MKRFLLIGTTIIIIIFCYVFFHYELGIFINFNPQKEVTTFVKTQEKEIYLKKDKKYEKFVIKGVDLGAGIPGEFATDYAIDKNTYKRWFKYIQEMGANTIRIYTILGDNFYNAFYEYNKDNDNPLYLIHGLWINDYVQNSRLDAYDSKFLGEFLNDSKKIVDIIHGKRLISLGTNHGTGFYYHDISDWVLGYILGVEWEDATVVYTNHMQEDKTSYQGKYIKSTSDATPFEVMLTEVGDKIIEYESTRYKEQRLVAFSNWPTTDPFDYSENITNYFKKMAKVDVEHIKATDKFLSGQFVSYHIYPYYPDYLNYEKEYNDYKDQNGVKNTYQAYLKKINDYHTMPVVISEFGVPSSRGMAQKDQNTMRNQGGMSEDEQGEAIVKCYQDMLSVGIENAIIFTWQDEWFKRTWNTMQNVNLQRTPYWSDYQTNEQYFGLLSFDSGNNTSISYNDGNVSEWKNSDVISKTDNASLSVKYDEKYVYFYINKNNYQGEKIYIAIDTTPKSGAYSSDSYNIKFNRPTDFLIVIDGKSNSHILVQERYNTLFALYGYEINEVNSYLNPPASDSSKFQKINLMLQTATPLLTNNKSEHAEVYETGKLKYGNGNPESDEFISNSDFYINGDFIEIRLPWELLNFSDPSLMTIHDDYYENFGVENINIDKMYVGIGVDGDTIEMNPLKLNKWYNTVTYHERLKKSYYIVQNMWVGSDK
ncbi:MAG: hypothetical protein IJ068_04465 [Bacilli bacterium]|nr:hypothetical protein [Bacilli bacterium]